MKSLKLLWVLLPLSLWSCGASFPPPTQRMNDAQSAERSARELGAYNQPASQLSLKLAQEQIQQAKTAMGKDENQRADFLLLRAQQDAELSIAQTREAVAEQGKNQAIANSTAQKNTNQVQGAIK
jgi:hypothetical protein